MKASIESVEKPLVKVIKVMDSILMDQKAKKNGVIKPWKWIYTDLLGRIQFKPISSIQLEEVIKAFLLNIKKSLVLKEGQI